MILVSVTALAADAVPSLTGANVFGTDADGNFISQHWNTWGGDSQWNLYLRDGDSWVNSGNSTPLIDVPMYAGTCQGP